MTIWLVLLGAYLLGALPVSYLAARLLRGIDLRQYGTGQAGAGNLWRMTAWKVGLPVGVFDFAKGIFMVWVAKSAGLDAAEQLVAGLVTIIGHNWSVFLHFSGGRGVATAIGVILIVPLINNLSLWGAIAFIVVAAVTLLIVHSTPLPVLFGLTAAPVVSWLAHGPLALTLGFLAILVVIVAKRLTTRQSAGAVSISKRQLLLNRLLFDRDIRDREIWMYRRPSGQGGQGKG